MTKRKPMYHHTFNLNTGRPIPCLGLGTWQLEGNLCIETVIEALNIGYRHIDTADRYGNHHDIAIALNQSPVPRGELYLTTKVWHTDLAYQTVLDKTKTFLDELETEYLDLLLIHWPNHEVPIQETLQAFHELQFQGMIRDYGVSNFTQHHLEQALQYPEGTGIVTNQIELHPSFSQSDIRNFHADHHILTTAYSPLGQGQDLEIPLIQEIATRYTATPAQIILAWLRYNQIIAIPKATTYDWLQQNLQSLQITLTPADITQLDGLDQNNRLLNRDFSEFDF